MSGALFLLLLAAASPSWQTVAPGVEHLRVDDDGLGAELLRFDLGRYRPEVVLFGARHPKTAAVARLEKGAAATVNGGFFDTDGRPLGLRIAAGKTVIGLRPRVDWGVLLVQAGRAQIVHSREYRADASIETAIQVGPRILVGGRPLRLKPQSARRTAVALDRDGRTLTLVVTRAAIEADRLAALLARLGFETALMLDGGPSTQLSADIGAVRLDVSGGYPVPDLLVIHKR